MCEVGPKSMQKGTICRTLTETLSFIKHDVTKIHRAFEFRQAAWMVPYIQLNNNLRVRATAKFEQDLFNHEQSSQWKIFASALGLT